MNWFIRMFQSFFQGFSRMTLERYFNMTDNQQIEWGVKVKRAVSHALYDKIIAEAGFEITRPISEDKYAEVLGKAYEKLRKKYEK